MHIKYFIFSFFYLRLEVHLFKSECNECLNRYTPTFGKVEEVGVVEGGGRVEGKREMERGGGVRRSR